MEQYPVFTKAMRQTHTILIPSMIDICFQLFTNVLNGCGYKCELLTNESYEVIEEGLKFVHNDTCYPATLIIGQFIDALNKRNDLDKIVLLITQTGGGCRASNYIHLLRKALKNAGYGYIPVISFGLTNQMEDDGFKFSLPLIRKLLATAIYGDALMFLYNKTRSYEKENGSSKKLVAEWIYRLSGQIVEGNGFKRTAIKKNLRDICHDFDMLEVEITEKIVVGIVGEIYVKYAKLGNNDLENKLVSEGCEIVVPGLLGFLFYCLYNMVYDSNIYGGPWFKILVYKFLIRFLSSLETLVIKAISKTKFKPMMPFKHTKSLNKGILSHGVKMGEGWLLTAEMIELIQTGCKNIICAQPFGCLPNHICGKGVMKKIKEHYPSANIVAIDYDTSASKVNQDNRIKLMLLLALEELGKNRR